MNQGNKPDEASIALTMDDVVDVLYSTGVRRNMEAKRAAHVHDPNCGTCQMEMYNNMSGVGDTGEYSDCSSDNYSDEEEVEVSATTVLQDILLHQMYGQQHHEITTVRNAITEIESQRKEADKQAQQLIQEEDQEREKEERKKNKKKKKKERQKQKVKERTKGQDTTPDNEENEERPSLLATHENSDSCDVQREEKVTDSVVGNLGTSSKNTEVKQEAAHSDTERMNSHSTDDEESIDTSSAFFSRAASKTPHSNTGPPVQALRNVTTAQAKAKLQKSDDASAQAGARSTSMPNQTNAGSDPTKSNSPDGVSPLVRRSREHAIHANRLASDGNFQEAIKSFQDAIQLDPTDFRFFGNRSVCFERVGDFENALRDAESAIKLAPQWPKGYYRKGRSFVGLKKYKEAEVAFEAVIKLEGHSTDAQFELTRVRTLILVEMGFDAELASVAVSEHSTVEAALEALLQGRVQPEAEVDSSDEEDEAKESDRPSRESPTFTVARSRGRPADNGVRAKKPTPPATAPSVATAASADQKAPVKSVAVWVGNINPLVVTEDSLASLFRKCGRVSFIKILPQKKCAFVNYNLLTEAEAAIEKLQGYEIGGMCLKLKFSDNPPPGFVQSTSVGSSKHAAATKSANHGATKSTASGECSFWRTTGCTFPGKCRFRHVPEHRGIDRR